MKMTMNVEIGTKLYSVPKFKKELKMAVNAVFWNRETMKKYPTAMDFKPSTIKFLVESLEESIQKQDMESIIDLEESLKAMLRSTLSCTHERIGGNQEYLEMLTEEMFQKVNKMINDF